jgi:hypothetical protein
MSKHTAGPWSLKSSQNYATEEYDCYLHPVGIYIPEMVSEADARLIAAAPELLEALVWREQFEAREGETSNDRFERVAEIFRRDTGYLRPGKDCRIESMEVRQQAWEEWLRAGNERARAAILKATT